MTEKGDVVLISGKPFPKAVGDKRKRLEDRIKKNGFEYTMEAMAYTWFNRLVAVRYMELHGYLEHGFRVLSHPEGHAQPEILEKAQYVDLPGLDQKKVIELKLDGTKEEDLYRLLLTAQFNTLSKAMPFLFEKIDDETELLLPDNLLNSDSLIRKLVTEIDEEDWKEVEIIGWLYQFYISDKKDEVIWQGRQERRHSCCHSVVHTQLDRQISRPKHHRSAMACYISAVFASLKDGILHRTSGADS